MRMLLAAGVHDIIGFDRTGCLRAGREDLSSAKRQIAEATNPRAFTGDVAGALVGADVFIGVARSSLLHRNDLMLMAPDAILLALANPDPEIHPDDVAGTVRVVGTGRSDCLNQVNSAPAFPGIFRGALDVTATTINARMKLVAARAIAACVSEAHLEARIIVPDALDRRVHATVASAVADAAHATGVTRFS